MHYEETVRVEFKLNRLRRVVHGRLSVTTQYSFGTSHRVETPYSAGKVTVGLASRTLFNQSSVYYAVHVAV